jgi:hypothetical protein
MASRMRETASAVTSSQTQESARPLDGVQEAKDVPQELRIVRVLLELDQIVVKY